MPQGQMVLPAVKPDGVAQLLTQQGQQVSLELGLGIHGVLDCENSNLSRFPAHPMT